VNVVLRDMAHLLGDREARPVLKVALTKAISMREKLRRHPCWN